MKVHTVDIAGFQAELPILTLPSGIGIAFFNLHGNSEMTEHCGKKLAELLRVYDSATGFRRGKHRLRRRF